MTIHIQLYGQLRDALPRANKGKTSLDVPAKSRIHDILILLDISHDVLTAINEAQESSFDTVLQDGDLLYIFPPVAGGSQLFKALHTN